MSATTARRVVIGDRLNDYSSYDVEVRDIASGGFGVVYLGPDRLSEGQWVAMKTLKPEILKHSKHAKDLFIREGLTWVGLWPHANLLTAQGVTIINNQPFLALNYAKYGSLREQFSAKRRQGTWFSTTAALSLAQQIVAGLVALHTPDLTFLRPNPIVHRDLKPENVLIEGHGYAQITDFGLAKVAEEAVEEDPTLLSTLDLLGVTGGVETQVIAPKQATRSQRYQTARGVAMGTLAYMAPEQWADAASAGPPADIYAFGVMLAELLTGRHPLLALEAPHSQADWREAHQADQPRSLAGLLATSPAFASTGQSTDRLALLSLAADIEGIYQACLAKQAQARPTAAEVLARLQQAARQLGEDPYTPPEVTPHTDEEKVIRWHVWAIAYLNFDLYDEALVRNDHALALAPTSSDVLTTRGNILAKLGRKEEALQAYDQALAALPPEDTMRRKIALSNRGACLRTMRRYADAEATYGQALVHMPDDATAWYNRANNQRYWAIDEAQSAHMAAAVEHVRQGISYAEQAEALNPQHPQFRALLDELRGMLPDGGGR